MSMGESYLVAGLLLNFPLAYLYRILIPHTSPRTKDLLLTLTGLALYTFCFGWDTWHVVAMATAGYTLSWCCGITTVTCGVVFLSSMCHLLYGYVTMSGISYTVSWTLIHCQALLKVVGYVIDHHDMGAGYPGSVLSYTAYVFFPFTCLVGPQFQYIRYIRFREQTTLPDSLKHSLNRVALGIIYIVLFYGIAQFTSTDYLISSTFLAYPLLLKLLIMTFWSKWFVTKYCAIWCIAEGAATITGMGGEAAGGWDGITNVEVRKFEGSLTIKDELTAFNVQTHQWVKRNVFKRCRRFNSPVLSRVASLTFLYLWHGIYFGFFNLFLVEGLGSSSEESLSRYLTRDTANRYIPRFILLPLQYLLKNMCVGYGLAGFALRSAERCHVFYSSVYYCWHVGLVVWLVVEGAVVRRMVKGKSE